jgi:hypothetical protein
MRCASTSPSLADRSIPWDRMSCKYQKHAKHQEGRVRYLEQELKVAREEISRLRDGNVSSSIREQCKLETWIKPKNSKSWCHRFSADDTSQVRLNNRVKERSYYWEAVMGGKLDPCSRKILALNLI